MDERDEDGGREGDGGRERQEKEVGPDDQSMTPRRLKIAKTYVSEAERRDGSRVGHATDQSIIDRMPRG
jgi:hypothetical protein